MKRWLGLFSSEDVVVVPMPRDMAREAADIHAVCFARAWTDGEIADLLGNANTHGFAATVPAGSQRAMAGFVLLRIAAGEAEILTIAVSPDWQGYGIGRRLMDHVLAHAHRERFESIFLEVEESNQAAVALYKKLGFFEVGNRPGYYSDPVKGRSRAIVMRRDVRPTRRAR